MRILNVAEKNDAAKNIAALLSGGSATRRESFSVYNKIYEFDCEVFGQNSRMVMTSVSGHLLNFAFVGKYKMWNSTDPLSLFEAPISKVAKTECKQIMKGLETEIKNCSKLIIWTDCDREGENIGFEIIEVCKSVRKDIQVHRAVFSEITPQSVRKALRNLTAPNIHISDAVNVRSELDLRIGAAFTRLQTLYLQKAFPSALSGNLVSYGTCQFPTLGFVVERFKAISEFKPEPFWQINVRHTVNELGVDFSWKRNRLFDKLACEVLYDRCVESGTAEVENVEKRPKKKYRPKPLDTVELQKLASRKFGMSAKVALKIAENLYTSGLISYPRTETNCFPRTLNLVPLVECQANDGRWGEFAQRVLRDGPDPFQGNKSDEAHPPIHPIKHTNTLKGDEKTIYEFVVRHFLACLSKHAEGLETTVDIDVAGEKFSAKGLVITARNYLEVYPYDKWSDKEIHDYHRGDVFKPEISMEESETTPPELLTEADLISLMDKHGIGTDATHAEHIETIKARLYVGLQNNTYLVPRTLGMGLIEGYVSMGYALASPEMRAELEADLKRICDRLKSPRAVLKTHIEKYKKVFEGVQRKMPQLSKAIQSYIEVEAVPTDLGSLTERPLAKCPSCRSHLVLKKLKKGGKCIGCSAFPNCRVALWLPSFVLEVTPTGESCPKCGPDHSLLRFKFKKGSCYLPPDYVSCIGGCDLNLMEMLNHGSGASTYFTGTRSMTESMPPDLQDHSHPTDDSGFVSRSHADEVATFFPDDDSPPNDFPGESGTRVTPREPSRKFYKYGASSRGKFVQGKTSTAQPRSSNARVEDGEDLRCYCSLPCQRFTVTKEGPNKGRPFFSCGKSFREQDKCNFFRWAENDENVDTFTGRTRQGERNNWTSASASRIPAKKRIY